MNTTKERTIRKRKCATAQDGSEAAMGGVRGVVEDVYSLHCRREDGSESG
jgi:hypothetical protein